MAEQVTETAPAPKAPEPSATVVVRCISENRPWAHVIDKDGRSELRPLTLDEEAKIDRALAAKMQKNRHVVIIGT